MTIEPVELEALLAARARMVSELQQGLMMDERSFLLSLVAAMPDWKLLSLSHRERLSGLRWKLRNLERWRKSDARKFAEPFVKRARLLISISAKAPSLPGVEDTIASSWR